MKSKTLVIILGQARADRLTWDSFKKNVLKVLEADLALCIGESPENTPSNQYWAHAIYRWVVPEYEDFGDGFDQIQLYRYGKNTDWRQVLTVPDQWLGGIKGKNEHPGSAGILVYLKAKLLEFLEQKEISKKYDRYVITRSDFIWEVPHPKLDRLDPDKIWIPYGEFYWGVTDRHVVLTSNYLRPYLDLIGPVLSEPDQLIRQMQTYNPKPNWNHEQYILFRLRSQGLEKKIRFLPYMMYSVREETTPTRWAEGEFDEELGFLVKYPAEKIRARLTRKYLTKKSGEVVLMPDLLFRWILKGLFSMKVRGWIS
ncbi:MAG: hypothetical protein EP311_03130 [Cytophagales bacterium]|nr:MAG: hypothetical protein EP311_03130 [Cytophagales bacterium]